MIDILTYIFCRGFMKRIWNGIILACEGGSFWLERAVAYGDSSQNYLIENMCKTCYLKFHELCCESGLNAFDKTCCLLSQFDDSNNNMWQMLALLTTINIDEWNHAPTNKLSRWRGFWLCFLLFCASEHFFSLAQSIVWIYKNPEDLNALQKQ